jgi:hypothetical protein
VAALVLVSGCGNEVLGGRGPLVVGQPSTEAADAGPPKATDGPVEATERVSFRELSASLGDASPSGVRQLRVVATVVNASSELVTLVALQDASLAWSNRALPVAFPSDTPNPTPLRPGASAPFFFIVGVDLPASCLSVPVGTPSTVEYGVVKMSFTAVSNLSDRRFENIDVGVECPP